MHRFKQLKDMARAVALAHELRSHDDWSAQQLADHQQAKLARLVRHAFENSPFYRDLYTGLTLDGEIDIRALPTTSKRMLMDNFDHVVTDPRLKLDRLHDHLQVLRQDEYYLGEYRVVATAGTSGLRGVFVYDRAAWSVVLANTIRWSRFTGISPRCPHRVRMCSIGADNPMHVTQRIPDSGNVGLFKVLHVEATEPLATIVGALNEFKPEIILPYPSLAAELATEQLAGRLQISPAVIATHSELLTEEMARRIEAAWKVRPFNHYGLTEEPHVGSDCDRHRGIHIFEDTCIVEVVNRNNKSVEPGVSGNKYLLTNLYNLTQPLIRYEVTDILEKSTQRCPCGRPFALIGQIGGRSKDILTLYNKQGVAVEIPPVVLTLRIEAVTDVAEYQVHHSSESIDVNVVPRSNVDTDSLRSTLVNEVSTAVETLGAVPPPVNITFVEGIERRSQHMGKVEIVSTYSKRATR